MPQKNQRSEDGSALIELAAAVLILVMPLPLGFELYQIQSNQLMVESIARHALRGAILKGNTIAEYELISKVISSEIQATWNSKSPVSLNLRCENPCRKGSQISIFVEVGSVKAVQTQVLDR